METRKHEDNEFVCPVCKQKTTEVITIMYSIMSYIGDIENKLFNLHEILYAEPATTLCPKCYQNTGIRDFRKHLKKTQENNPETTQNQ